MCDPPQVALVLTSRSRGRAPYKDKGEAFDLRLVPLRVRAAGDAGAGAGAWSVSVAEPADAYFRRR